MTNTTSGGRTIKVLSGRSAADLLRYRDALKRDKRTGTTQEPNLFIATRHCSLHSVDLQILEFKQVRKQHGTNGTTRAVRARHETVDPMTGLHANGQTGTHVSYHDGKRWRKRRVRDGERPTHLRIEPEGPTCSRQSEAIHTIYAFSAELVNPDNHEDLERAFGAVVAERNELYPGIQESIWGERNGASGLFHVHVASNATIYSNFTLEGVEYRSGQKMAGQLTHVHTVRSRSDVYLDRHPEFGFSQSLPLVGSQDYQQAQLRSGQKDYWDQKRGHVSGHARIRQTITETINDPRVTSHSVFIDEMRSRGVEVNEIGLRRGKPGASHDYAYKLTPGKRAVRGKTLGADYTYGVVDAQLQSKSLGQNPAAGAAPSKSEKQRLLPFERRPMMAQEQIEYAALVDQVDELAELARQREAPQVTMIEPVAPKPKATPSTFEVLLAEAHAETTRLQEEANLGRAKFSLPALGREPTREVQRRKSTPATSIKQPSQRASKVEKALADSEEEQTQDPLAAGTPLIDTCWPKGTGQDFFDQDGNRLDGSERDARESRVAKEHEQERWYRQAADAQARLDAGQFPSSKAGAEQERMLKREAVQSKWVARQIKREVTAGDYSLIPEKERRTQYSQAVAAAAIERGAEIEAASARIKKSESEFGD